MTNEENNNMEPITTEQLLERIKRSAEINRKYGFDDFADDFDTLYELLKSMNEEYNLDEISRC